MRKRVGLIAVGVCICFVGCVPSEDMQMLVTNPFNHTPDVQPYQAAYSPAAKETALRVDGVGQQIVKANPQMALRPMFLTIASPQPEVFHRGTTEIYVTEGLANKCVTEGQLAAVLSSELAKMVVDREVLALPETRQPERSPPPEVPVGNDNSTLFGAADGTRRVELAKFERDRIPRRDDSAALTGYFSPQRSTKGRLHARRPRRRGAAAP